MRHGSPAFAAPTPGQHPLSAAIWNGGTFRRPCGLPPPVQRDAASAGAKVSTPAAGALPRTRWGWVVTAALIAAATVILAIARMA